MKIEVFTYIEVENMPNAWAVELHECKEIMKPTAVKFAMIHNDLSNEDVIYIDCTLTDTKPEKITDSVNRSVNASFIEVGFWRVKEREYSLIGVGL